LKSKVSAFDIKVFLRQNKNTLSDTIFYLGVKSTILTFFSLIIPTLNQVNENSIDFTTVLFDLKLCLLVQIQG